MFDKTYEERLVSWREFRDSLSRSKDPISDTIECYSFAPRVGMHTDPYDTTTWPSPWELLDENIYCNYCILLAICYTLQLSEQFKGVSAEIHIGINREESDTWYLLQIDNNTIGYRTNDETIKRIKPPSGLHLQKIHHLSPRQ